MQAFDHDGSEIRVSLPSSSKQALEPSPVEPRLEAICRKGCRLVRRDIRRLELGEEIPESRGLSAAERALLLRELRDIMSVYGDSCAID